MFTDALLSRVRHRRSLAVIVAGALVIAPALGIGAPAVLEMRPIDVQPSSCTNLIDPAKLDGRTLDWRDTIFLEHCDRIQRLWRLTGDAPPDKRPLLSETSVPAGSLPKDVGTDVPLLRVVFPDRVFFETGSDELLPDSLRVIDVVAQNLGKEVGDLAIFVVGHTDSRGGRDYNQDLSVRRAESVAKAILGKPNSAKAHIWRVGFGKDFPLAENDSPEHMALNRRVEFLFAEREEAAIQYLSQLEQTVCTEAPDDKKGSCRQSVTTPGTGYTVVEMANEPTTVTPKVNGAVTETPDQKQVTVAPTPIKQVVVTPIYNTHGPVTPIYQAQKN